MLQVALEREVVARRELVDGDVDIGVGVEVAGSLKGAENYRLCDGHRCGLQCLHQSRSGRHPELLGDALPPLDRPVQDIGGKSGTCHTVKVTAAAAAHKHTESTLSTLP